MWQQGVGAYTPREYCYNSCKDGLLVAGRLGQPKDANILCVFRHPSSLVEAQHGGLAQNLTRGINLFYFITIFETGGQQSQC
jgi:hypothetical protein